jgi:hypothetical protein
MPMKFSRVFVALLLTGLVSGLAIGARQSDRKLLATTWPLGTLRDTILDREQWKPFPTWSEPDGFAAIPKVVREAQARRGEAALSGTWTPLPATVFLDFVRNGNRSRYESLSFGRRTRLADLVLAEVLERKGRFTDEIVNGIWTICEESFWGVPAHVGVQRRGAGLPDKTDPVVDLFAAETGALLAWTHYLLKPQLDAVSPLVSERIVLETRRRLLDPYLERYDMGWMGYEWRAHPERVRPVNNWNPWINSNILTCALLLETDPVRRIRLVHKAMDSIDNFIAPYPSDGGCDEGPSYWGRAGGSLFDCLEILYSASGGKIDVFDQPLIQRMGQYIYRAYISDPYFIDFADATARMRPEAPLVFRYGKAIGDSTMTAYSAYVADLEKLGAQAMEGNFGVLNRVLPALFCLQDLLRTKPEEPLIRDTWLGDIGVMTARSLEGSRKGFYLAAKAGHNGESHNHNDVGNFIVFYDGAPVLIDAGAQTYTAQTFSSRRYELWNNQSAYHNLPTINGVMQSPGREFEAREVEYSAAAGQAELSMDLAAAYPEQAGVKSWKRRIVLNRGDDVTVSDNFQLSEYRAPSSLSLLTSMEPTGRENGIVLLESPESANSFQIEVTGADFKVAVDPIEISDDRMMQSWGNRLYRVRLMATSADLSGAWKLVITAVEPSGKARP